MHRFMHTDRTTYNRNKYLLASTIFSKLGGLNVTKTIDLTGVEIIRMYYVNIFIQFARRGFY